MECAKIILCKSDRSFLGNLTGLKEDTCSLTKNITSPWEITFEVERYIEDNGVLVQSDYYDSIDEMMKLYLDTGDEQIFFVIDSEPEIHGEGSQEVKTVIAHSEECELSNTILNNIKINCGTQDSQEYLATDENGNFNNINSYTGLPIEYISLVNYENEQLSLLHLVLQNTGWKVKDDIDLEVCNIKASFDISNTNVYAFLMNTVSTSISVIFEFDRKHKQVSAVKVTDYGEDTGVFITMRNLMNSFNVSSSSDDSIITKLIPIGANNIGIEYVNFGAGDIINLDYFMNTLNEYGDYKYVSEELHDKYTLWKNYRDSDKVEYNGKEYTRRELYAELTRLYNRTVLDISELKNRVPNDGTIIDYKTYSYEDLTLSLTAYNNALDALITLYKNEYGVIELGESPDYLPVPSSATNIKDTPYWFDFYAYKEKIIPQVIESLKMYCQTDVNGNLMVDSNGEYIKLEFGNPDYYSDENIVKNINSYLYEWSLYGLDELESKKKAWSEAANILFNECFVKLGTVSSPTAYLTADEAGWNSLTQDQKGQFTTQKAFIDKLNSYLDYMSFDVRDNSLTKTKCKGIIRQCEDAIKTRNDEILSLTQIQKSYNIQRAQLSSDVVLNKFFSDKEMNVINSMLHESEYKNENIIITSLDDIVSTVDVQQSLYQSAVEELYKLSQPQYDFSTEIDNIYALEEFESYQKPFRIGNFIRVGLETHEELFDSKYIKLRISSITYNPLMFNENITVEFSTMIKSMNGINDLAFLLNSESNLSASGSSTSSSPTNSGTYGNNDANVQISNNMLNALLSTELFGTTVNDVILDSIKANKGNFNTLLSHSGVFDSLESGQIKVSGTCLFDRINSSNWNGNDNNLLSNTVGSILDLTTGKFNLGGGRLKWDGENLLVNGNGKFTGEIQGTSGTFNGAVTATTLTANQSGSIAGWQFNDKSFYKNDINIGGKNGFYIGEDGISIGDYFVVDKKGMMVQDKNFEDIYDISINIPRISSEIALDELKVEVHFNHVSLGDRIHLNIVGYYDYSESPDGVWPDGSITVMGDYFISVENTISVISGTGPNTTETWLEDSITGEFIEENNILILYISGALVNSYTPYAKDGIAHDRDGNVIYKIQDFRITQLFTSKKSQNSLVYNSAEIKKVQSDVYTSSGVFEIFNIDGDVVGKSGLTIDTVNNNIAGGEFELVSDGLKGYNNFTFSIKEGFNNNVDIFKLNSEGLYHNGLSTSSAGTDLVIANGYFHRKSASSGRYKNSIKLLSKSADELNPDKLYDVKIVSFKYNQDYLSQNDQRYNQEIPGFIAEDIYDKYPIACNLDKDGNPEMWNINILFPAALKLIQDQHKEIKAMKQQFQELKMFISDQNLPIKSSKVCKNDHECKGVTDGTSTSETKASPK